MIPDIFLETEFFHLLIPTIQSIQFLGILSGDVHAYRCCFGHPKSRLAMKKNLDWQEQINCFASFQPPRAQATQFNYIFLFPTLAFSSPTRSSIEKAVNVTGKGNRGSTNRMCNHTPQMQVLTSLSSLPEEKPKLMSPEKDAEAMSEGNPKIQYSNVGHGEKARGCFSQDAVRQLLPTRD